MTTIEKIINEKRNLLNRYLPSKYSCLDESFLKKINIKEKHNVDIIEFSDDGTKVESRSSMIKIGKKSGESNTNVFYDIEFEKDDIHLIYISKDSSNTIPIDLCNQVLTFELASLYSNLFNKFNPSVQICKNKFCLVKFKESMVIALGGYKTSNTLLTYEFQQEFSHFTLVASNYKHLMVDIKGCGNIFLSCGFTTHAINEYGDKDDRYGIGNLGKDGINSFIKSHVCTKSCKLFKIDTTIDPQILGQNDLKFIKSFELYRVGTILYNMNPWKSVKDSKYIGYFKDSSKLNNSYALNTLGYIWEINENNIQNAMKYYKKSAQLGNPKAHFNIGHAYEAGMVEGGTDLAIDHYKQSALLGHIDALNCLANLYMDTDMQKSINYFREAFEYNDEIAAYSLGSIYYELHKTRIATQYFMKSADKHFINAKRKLVEIFTNK